MQLEHCVLVELGQRVPLGLGDQEPLVRCQRGEQGGVHDGLLDLGWQGSLRVAGPPAPDNGSSRVAARQLPIRPARMLVTTTDVIVTVENPATIIFGRIDPSMAATSSGLSPAPLAASCERIIVPGKP